MLARVQRRAGICFEETNRILKEIADGLIGQLLKMDAETSETLNDLNTLFAIVCALAVLQDISEPQSLCSWYWTEDHSCKRDTGQVDGMAEMEYGNERKTEVI